MTKRREDNICKEPQTDSREAEMGAIGAGKVQYPEILEREDGIEACAHGAPSPLTGSQCISLHLLHQALEAPGQDLMLLQEGAPLGDQCTHSLPALLGQGYTVRVAVVPGAEWILGWEGDGVWAGCLGVTWMRCTMEGRAWLQSDWSGTWDLGVGETAERRALSPCLDSRGYPMPAHLGLVPGFQFHPQ